MLDPLRLAPWSLVTGAAMAPRPGRQEPRTKEDHQASGTPTSTLATSRTLSGLALSHTATTSSNATPLPRDLDTSTSTSTVYRCSARVCVQCAGVPAPRLPLSTPQGPSTAAVGRGRGRRVPLRAAAAWPIRQRPGCRRSPPCLRSRRPICMHCSVTIERTCIKQLPAAATRFSWSLDMRGGISPSWLEVLLCAAAVPHAAGRADRSQASPRTRTLT